MSHFDLYLRQIRSFNASLTKTEDQSTEAKEAIQRASSPPVFMDEQIPIASSADSSRLRP